MCFPLDYQITDTHSRSLREKKKKSTSISTPGKWPTSCNTCLDTWKIACCLTKSVILQNSFSACRDSAVPLREDFCLVLKHKKLSILVQTRLVWKRKTKQKENSLFCRCSRYFFFVLDGYAGCKESVSRFCHASPKPPWKDVLVFHKSVDVVLGSVFTCGNLENKGYTEQSLLGVTVCHHLQGANRGGKKCKGRKIK